MSQTDIQCSKFSYAEKIIDIIRKNIITDSFTIDLWNEEALGLSWILNSWNKFLTLYIRVSDEEDLAYLFETVSDLTVSDFTKSLLKYNTKLLKCFENFVLFETNNTNDISYLDTCSDLQLKGILFRE